LPTPSQTNSPSQGGLWGIIGGTFNPIHLGHLVLAEAVREELGADGILFVPAPVHPYKASGVLAPYSDRLAMVRAAIEENEQFILEELPLDARYTIDQLRLIRERYPEARFVFAIGADLAAELESWHKPGDVVSSIDIIIASRPGYPANGGGELLRDAKRVAIPLIDLSSSDIRKRLAEQRSIRYLVPAAVERIIRTRGLYGEK
jgi:nicotinate-nucleotide adenylyltransferase